MVKQVLSNSSPKDMVKEGVPSAVMGGQNGANGSFQVKENERFIVAPLE